MQIHIAISRQKDKKKKSRNHGNLGKAIFVNINKMLRILLLIIIPLFSVAQPSGKYVSRMPGLYSKVDFIEFNNKRCTFVSNVGIDRESGRGCLTKGRYRQSGDTLSLCSNNLPKGKRPVVKTYYDPHIPQDSVKITMVNSTKGYYCYGLIINSIKYFTHNVDDTISFFIPRTSELLKIMCIGFSGGYPPVKVFTKGINSVVLYVVKSKFKPLYCVWYDRRVIIQNGVLKMLFYGKEIKGKEYVDTFDFYPVEK